ncbi:uncharacterized protein LOC127042845 isoform X5 [Gopherus flavomarginatus]|uniref:uncharacterized protein LOC127042845 isoform X5 n=1 Tax=Gopherus flavomarginatus TaxID=286002 RepID=UPI0021CBAA00|nr:uncharacterized protein LOC127042845 isoform X5 [Gopherus flavomarginatus]
MDSARAYCLPQVPASSPALSFPSSAAAAGLTRARARAEAQLRSAVACERAMRWSEVVEHYTALLKTLSKEELPKDFEPGPYYSQLLFETYYHLAVALQRQNHHKEAVQELNKAIEVASIPKIACQVGCVSRTFLHTPLFARRAYAYVKCGHLKEAIDDANKAVELDPLNPAYKLDKTSKNFFDVEDFHSPKMDDFYDRYLWSLNVPHTIMQVNLMAGSSFISHLPSDSFHREKRMSLLPEQNVGSFICSAPTSYLDNTAFARRASYGKALKDSGLKLNASKISERILRITRVASEWSERRTSRSPVKIDSKTIVASTPGILACKKKPGQKKSEASKIKSKK